jgi:hypothetical protein
MENRAEQATGGHEELSFNRVSLSKANHHFDLGSRSLHNCRGSVTKFPPLDANLLEDYHGPNAKK